MWDLQKMWHFGRLRPRRACAAPFMLINPNTTWPAAHRCLHSVRRGVSLWQSVTYVTILNLEKKENQKFELQKEG